MRIVSGSFTRLSDFETCPYRAKLKYVDKIPEPERGEPTKGKEWADERGSRIHDEAEQFVKGEIETLPLDLVHFSKEFHQVRELHNKGMITTEEMWCFDEHWKPIKETDYKNTRFRIKMDLTVRINPTWAAVIDYKTGKRYGNEIKHDQQKLTYAVGMFKRESKIQKVTTELWYLDLPNEDLFPTVLTRAQAGRLLRSLDERNKRMLEATSFPPKANKYNCRWCPYNGKKGEQICKHAVH